MTQDKLNDAVFAKLSDYIIPEQFRTVKDVESLVSGGISEVKVVIDMTETFASKLSFPRSTMNIIYGFTILSEKVREINGARYIKDGVLRKIGINDWGDKFLVVFEVTEGLDPVIFVTSDEVRYLLENCRRAPY